MRCGLLLVLLFSTFGAHAARVELTLSELRQALDGDGGAEPLDAPALLRLQQEMGRLGMRWTGARLSIESSMDAPLPLKTGCRHSATLERLDTRLTLLPETLVGIEYDSLRQPMRLAVQAPVKLSGKGDVLQAFGVELLGDCRRYGRDGFGLSLEGAGRLRLTLVLDPGIVLGDERLTVTPRVSVALEWERLDYSVRIDDTAADEWLESSVRALLNRLLSEDGMAALGQRLETAFDRRVAAAWGGPTLMLDTTGMAVAQREALRDLLQRDLRFTEAERYLRDHLAGLWYALLAADRRRGGGILSAAGLCEVVAQTAIPMPVSPLFRREAGACRQVDAPGGGPGRYYVDAACTKEVRVVPQTHQQYCRANFDPLRVGDGARLDEPAWHLSPGTRTTIPLSSNAGLHQPWVMALPYKRVATPAGECVLEMRVYKSRIGASGLKPAMALHGGSWKFRTHGILGIEGLVPQLTSRGFVVFVPFYRLTGDAEGTAACHDASGAEIVADIDDALDWVRANASRFGALSTSVAVTGQSAGAYLAAWLSVHRPASVSRALLLYPPTDMADYLQQWREGESAADDDGVGAVKAFLGDADPATVSLMSPLIRGHSLPQIVVQQPAAFPPIHIVHGSGDRVVPLRQAARLCNALGGDIEGGPAPVDGPVGQHTAYACDDRGSRLQVIAGAGHMLDICPSALWCPAGDGGAQAAARAAMQAGYDWLAAAPQRVAGDAAGRGGGVLSWWPGALFWVRRRRLSTCREA